MQSDFKALLHLTSQKLGQIRARSVAQVNITRSDIATLVQQGVLSIAREKAEKSISEEAFQNVLQDLEIYLGVLAECFDESEQNLRPSPRLIEAASTIIYAAPYIRSRDLDACRAVLLQRLGHDFSLSAAGNFDHHVSSFVLRNIPLPVPSASQLDHYIRDIADAYSIPWSPWPSTEYIITALSECLDVDTQPEVDLSHLRELCKQGIPDYPEWLRPRIWKLLLGVLPLKKSSWKPELMERRIAYYDLVRRVLDPFGRSDLEYLPGDRDLLAIYKQLSGLPESVYSLLEGEPEMSEQCPLDGDAAEDIRVSSASLLNTRLAFLQNRANDASSPTPEIRLESSFGNSPEISYISSDATLSSSASVSTTLLPSRKYVFGNAHPKHCSNLLRLLYIHKSMNPESSLSRSASILVPLYSVLGKEVDSEDLPHVEADTFWLFEAVLAEFSALEDDGESWMKALGERLHWADFDLSKDLESRGLDPSLPHYSFRWLMHMLVHTLPLQPLFATWDSLFSYPPRDRGSQPKLEHLLDVCTSMLIRAKAHLNRLGSTGQNLHHLWTTRLDHQPPISMALGRRHDPFTETLSFLQFYDPKYIGGIERVLQTASELSERRKLESNNSQWRTLGASRKLDIWMKPKRQTQLTNAPAEGGINHVSREEVKNMEAGRQSSLPAQITDIIWKGITNRSAMEDETISPPISPQLPVLESSQNDRLPMSESRERFIIWDYAERVKNSNTIAMLSKAGTNWRARRLMPSWNMTSWNTLDQPSESVKRIENFASPPPSHEMYPNPNSSPSSSPTMKSSSYGYPFYSSTVLPPSGSDTLIDKTKLLVSKTRSSVTNPGIKSAPKPLLLNSSSSIISSHTGARSGSPGSWSTPDKDEWADVMNAKRHHFHEDSQSSISSLSPTDAFGRTPKSARLMKEKEANSSRFVALSRRSVSPMAPAFRVSHSRPSSRNSSISSGYNSPPIHTKSPLQQASNERLERTRRDLDFLPTSPLIGSLPSLGLLASGDKHREKESDGSNTTPNELPDLRENSLVESASEIERRDATPVTADEATSRTGRMRTKRYTRPANLEIPEHQGSHASVKMKTSSSSKLVVEWPGGEQDNSMTPKALTFDSANSPGPSRPSRRPRKLSPGSPEQPRRFRTNGSYRHAGNVSGGSRTRKVSTESKDGSKIRRDSAGAEGDDEGYDELLSAYEGEDGPDLFTR